MKTGEEIAGGFLVARCDTSELLDILKEPFDQIALPIEGEIALTLDFAVRLGRDDRLDLARFEARDVAVGVIAFVGEEGVGPHLGGECFGLVDVVNLSAGEAQRQRIAQSIDDDMNFRSQAAARTAYGLIETPFFRAPALC